MREHIDKIKAYLEARRAEEFTGGIKMQFEKGLPKTFWKATFPEFQIKPIDGKFNIDKELSKATAGAFSGTLVFMLENGNIRGFNSIEVHQGRDLLDMLDGYRPAETSPRGGEKRPAVVIRKKG